MARPTPGGRGRALRVRATDGWRTAPAGGTMCGEEIIEGSCRAVGGSGRLVGEGATALSRLRFLAGGGGQGGQAFGEPLQRGGGARVVAARPGGLRDAGQHPLGHV